MDNVVDNPWVPPPVPFVSPPDVSVRGSEAQLLAVEGRVCICELWYWLDRLVWCGVGGQVSADGILDWLACGASARAGYGTPGRLIMDSRRESGGDKRYGEGPSAWSGLGELLHEVGGVNRDPPLRTWHVGHILTKRDINSFGTLEEVACQ